jgi:hypothetical protein
MLIALILLTVAFLVALGFGVWAYTSRQDYKDNSDEKAAAAVTAAEAVLSEKKEAEFAEREKEPLKTYKGPATFGSVEIQYPKTWGAFITEKDNGSELIDGYMHPNFVPGMDSGTAFAIHFEVVNTSYDQELKKFENATESGKVTVSPASAPRVPGTAGVRIVGEVESKKQGTVLLFPLRDKTLKITSESTAFTNDLDNIILKNLIFVP